MVLINILVLHLRIQFDASAQDPPPGAFDDANLENLELTLRHAANMGRFQPDPMVAWTKKPCRVNFETYLAHMSGTNPYVDHTRFGPARAGLGGR